MLPDLIAHLDLKGIQRRPEFVLRHLETLAALGYGGILVEYEDVFPYQAVDFSLSAEEVWSRDFLQEFLATAAHCGLEVIPLHQCLGHLEYALRWERYQKHGIRNPANGELIELSTLAIHSPESRSWLKGLLQDVMDAHPDSRWVHLGMDEAWSLTAFASESRRDPMDLFLEWLEELCDFCAERGRTPLIWSDMLEDHVTPSNFDRLEALRDKVVLAPWDYTAGPESGFEARFSGWRASRFWRENPRASDRVALRGKMKWMEDWPQEMVERLEPYRLDERRMRPLFQAGFWKSLGFQVVGTCGITIMREGPIMPHYHRRMDNVDQWKDALMEWDLDGLIVSAWARGGTFYPPTVFPDLHLPMLAYASGRKDGVFQGLDRESLWNIVESLGRCSDNWTIFSEIIDQMEQCSPSLSSHPYEWKSLILMARVMEARKDADSAIADARSLGEDTCIPPLYWGYRANRVRAISGRLAELREAVHNHFSLRYCGRAMKEWIQNVFEAPLTFLRQVERDIARRQDASQTIFREPLI